MHEKCHLIITITFYKSNFYNYKICIDSLADSTQPSTFLDFFIYNTSI